MTLTITSFSPDSGTVGDGITKNSAITLNGTATAGSAVKIYDGTTLLGSATANASGVWSYATGTLLNGTHSFTAATGAISSPPSGFPDASTTGVPAGMVLTTVTGDFSSSSAGQVIDGLNVRGTIIVDDPGVIIKNCQAEYIIIKADNVTIQDSQVVGNSSYSRTNAIDIRADHATVQRVDISGTENGIWLEGNNAVIRDNYIHDLPYDSQRDPHIDGLQVPEGPGVSNALITHNNFALGSDHITSSLMMSDIHNSTISYNRFDGGAYNVYFEDGSSGNQLTNNTFAGHTYGYLYPGDSASTAQTYGGNVTESGTAILGGTATSSVTAAVSTGETSAALSVTIDTVAPSAPTIKASTSAAVLESTHVEVLVGVAEAKSKVAVFDGTTKLATVTADSNGAWTYTTAALSAGSHSFTANATDAAGNTGATSSAATVTIGSDPAPIPPVPPTPTADIQLTDLSQTSWGVAKIRGVADAGSVVKLYDGSTSIGSTTAGADGTWTFTKSGLSNTIHKITAQEVSSSGQAVSTSSGAAILGSTRSDKLSSTAGDDLFLGNCGQDTFAFAANFGHDVIKDIDVVGRIHDVVQFSKSVFDSFASVLEHASQVGRDVVISTDSDTLTLKNTKLSYLDSHDFRFV